MVKKFMQNWGPRVTVIPIICTEGIIDIGIYAGNVNAVTFLNFVTEKLGPNILPFNGRNPRSVDAIHATGAMVIFFTTLISCLWKNYSHKQKNWITENDAAWQFCQDPVLMVE